MRKLFSYLLLIFTLLFSAENIVGQTNYIMGSGVAGNGAVINTCGGNFYDNGGNGGDYAKGLGFGFFQNNTVLDPLNTKPVN